MNSIDSIKITVVIPVYNAATDLRKCLDSIINQTYKNLEIILIDDGSTDGSGSICEDYAKKDERIKYFHQKNCGVSASRNKGIAVGTGDYYHFMDSDDYLEEDAYEFMLCQLKKNNADAICFEYFTTYPNREYVHKAEDNKYGLLNTADAVYEHLFSGRTFLCTKLLPSYSIKSIKFYESIYRDEDTIFCMMALHQITKTIFVERAVYHYVQSEESACRGNFRANQLSAVDAIPIMEDFLLKNYPQWMSLWRITYMHLMIMLYNDMYMDNNDWDGEMKKIYNIFRGLYDSVYKSDVKGLKNKCKFYFFYNMPKLFGAIHKIRQVK